jgi:hypothetical protein
MKMALSQSLRSAKFANVLLALNVQSVLSAVLAIVAIEIAAEIVAVKIHVEIIVSHTAAAEPSLQMENF